MVFANHTRIVAAGTLGDETAPSEIWSCTINALLDPANTLGDAMATDIWNAWASYITNSSMRFANWTYLRYVKVMLVDTTGHVPGTVYRHDGTAVHGIASANNHPPQCSLAVSLRTGERGPSKRGRFFLPPQGVSLESSTLAIAAEDRNAMEAPTKTFLDALQDAVGLIQVASSKGYNTQVTGFNIGRVYDTQRRRRNALVEAYEVPVAL